MKDKIKFIKELAESMNENKIETVKYEEASFEIQLSKKKKERNIIVNGGGVAPAQYSQAAPVQQEVASEETVNEASSSPAEEITGTEIVSPMVGTFYDSASPASEPFIKEGDTVTEGQTICIVEAMKLMNEVKSTVNGKVKKIFVKNGDAIKKGQTIAIIG